jgi:putative spermidine/putrescine transport system substrate-binding protein
MKRDDRRFLVAILIGAVAGMLLAADPAGVAGQESRFDGLTLRVGTWGGSWRDTVHDLIGKELERRGAKVEYVIGNPADNLAKVIAGRGRSVPIDVVELDTDLVAQMAAGGLLEEIRLGSLPNAAELAPNQRHGFAVATAVSEHGIVFNTKVFEQLGIPKPERFRDLMNPKLAGRVSFPDINAGPAVSGIIGFAVDGGGDESSIEPGLQLIRKREVAAFWKSAVELSTRFKSGDVWAAVWHAGWAVRLRRAGVPVGMSFPAVKDREGVAAVVWVGIPRGGQARPAAEFFINRYLDPEVQFAFSKAIGSAPVNRTALARLAEDPELKGVMRLTPEEIQKLYYPDWSKVNMKDWVSRWSRVMAR